MSACGCLIGLATAWIGIVWVTLKKISDARHPLEEQGQSYKKDKQ